METGDLVLKYVKNKYYVGIITSVGMSERHSQNVYTVYWPDDEKYFVLFYSDIIRFKNLLDVYVSRNKI
jgi:hypothetical protein